jgi:solute carrier family 10 (sodium/bile acid cotransporter), member 7
MPFLCTFCLFLVLSSTIAFKLESINFSKANIRPLTRIHTRHRSGNVIMNSEGTVGFTQVTSATSFSNPIESMLHSSRLFMTALKDEVKSPQARQKRRKQFKSLCKQNWLVLGEVIVIAIAKVWPELMASGGILRAEWLVGKLGVCIIFFLNGIALSIDSDPNEVKNAAKTNALIQIWNMAFIPLVAFVLARFYPDKQFFEGLLVLSCVPQTINISVAQTMSAGGDMGTAIFNAIFGNLLGVILTPLLAVLMVGVGQDVSLLHTLKKLGYLVVAPMALGQLCRRTPLVDIAERFNKKSRTICSLILLGIVWNTFSDTFMRGMGISGQALLGLITAMPIAYIAFCALFWKLSFYVVPNISYRVRAAALFCSSQKTLAFGIPFIKTAFGTRPDIAQILAPLLLYAPAELLIGSTLMVPKMVEVIAKSEAFEEGSGI